MVKGGGEGGIKKASYFFYSNTVFDGQGGRGVRDKKGVIFF